MAECKECGDVFTRKSKRTKFCPECKVIRRKRTAKLAARKRYSKYYEWLQALGCSFCKITSPSCLEVHHLSKGAKRYGTEKTRGQSDVYNRLDVQDELATVLCSNCHSTFHRHWGGKGADFPDQSLESTMKIINLEYERWSSPSE